MLRSLLLLLLVLCVRASAGEHWIRVRTPHFEMYTTNSERQAEAAIEQFERVRYFFLQSSASRSVSDAPVRIIAFRSEKEYKPYRLNGGAFAYYLRSRKIDYIVMQDISPEHYQTATHEYTHLIVEHLGFKLPLWLNEGLADLYSSLESRGDQAIVGRPLTGRMEVLRTDPWLDPNTLLAVKEDSPYYNQTEKMSIFYAESWALTHMLALGTPYHADFPRFLSETVAGRPTAECFEKIYHKSPTEVFRDLQNYVRQSSVRGAVYNVKLKAAELDPQVSEVADVDVQLALEDLLSARPGTVDEAFRRLAELAREHPDDADIEESLGYLAWRRGDKAKTRECFGQAFKSGSQNGEMLWQYAGLMQEAQIAPEQIVPVLTRASELKPENREVWFNLGMLQMQLKHWAAATSAFSHVKSVPDERAFVFFSAVAFCQLQMNDLNAARTNARMAKQYAKTPEQTARAAQMLTYLDTADGRAAGTSSTYSSSVNATAAGPPMREARSDLRHVKGVAKALACSSKIPQLHVMVDGREMVFELADPQGILVHSSKGGVVEFRCGAQKPIPLEVFYVPETGNGNLDGAAQELVF